jgi:hypothetical protein
MHRKFGGKEQLRRQLLKDCHFTLSRWVLSKENGLNVEGVAARGARVWLGPRGSVRGSSAVILELDPRPTRKAISRPAALVEEPVFARISRTRPPKGSGT